MSDGSRHFMAFDLVVAQPGRVHRAPYANEVPVQGSAEAHRWGVHMNVGVPGHRGFESWHIQPIEMDGFTTWRNAGSHRPHPGYPIPHDWVNVHEIHAANPHHVAAPPEGHDGIPKGPLGRGHPGHEVQLLQVALRTWHNNDHRSPTPATLTASSAGAPSLRSRAGSSTSRTSTRPAATDAAPRRSGAQVENFLSALDHDSG